MSFNLLAAPMGIYRKAIFLFCTILTTPAIFSFSYLICSGYHLLWEALAELLSNLLPPSGCEDELCTQYLSPNDMDAFDLCTKRSKAGQQHLLSNQPCRFNDSTSRAPVALASYPGSGNTWVRGLLQRATGVCTGSVYCDSWLRTHGFPAEGVRSGAVLVTKTHYPSVKAESQIECPPPLWSTGGEEDIQMLYRDYESPRWGSVIFVVRNPFDAMVSEFNRLNSGGAVDNNTHVDSIDEKHFGYSYPWQMFVRDEIPKWTAMISNYLLQDSPHRVLCVAFENIKEDLLGEVKRMLDFLSIEYSDEELIERLLQDFTTFRRSRKEVFDHYTYEQRALVNAFISSVMSLLEGTPIAEQIPLDSYLFRSHPESQMTG